MAGYNSGDITVDKLMITSPRGSLNLTSSFVTASVYESIFVPAMVCDIQVLDTKDELGQLKITGDETIDFVFKAPGGTAASYKFALHKLTKVTGSAGGQKSKQYMLNCVSEEAMHAKTNYVQKSYNMQIDAMVKDIVKTYLKSNKTVDAEETKGKQNILIPSLNPYKAISTVRKRATSGSHKSSAYVFFETRQGSKQILKFCTIEKLFEGSTVKKFKQEDTVGHSINSKTDNNIIAYEVPDQFNSVERIQTGGKRRIATFNARTHKYEFKDTTPDIASFKTGGKGKYDSGQFKSKYFEGAKIPPQSVIPIDASSGKRPNTGIPESTADQQAYIGALMQNAIKIRVPGDAAIKVGDMIEASIPVKSGFTGPKGNDKMLTGKFLVTRLHHQILSQAERPRYTCVIELVKGALEEGV